MFHFRVPIFLMMKAPLLPTGFIGELETEEKKPGGILKERITKDEKGHVQKTVFHSNGEIKTYEEWFKNKRHGLYAAYDEKGNIVEGSWWINGTRTEAWRPDKNLSENNQT